VWIVDVLARLFFVQSEGRFFKRCERWPRLFVVPEAMVGRAPDLGDGAAGRLFGLLLFVAFTLLTHFQRSSARRTVPSDTARDHGRAAHWTSYPGGTYCGKIEIRIKEEIEARTHQKVRRKFTGAQVRHVPPRSKKSTVRNHRSRHASTAFLEGEKTTRPKNGIFGISVKS
jgi:hypothetical protein